MSSSLYPPTLRQRRGPQMFRLRDKWRSGTRSWIHCKLGLVSFPPILCLKLPFSQPSSHLTLRLYARRSAHPDILIGTYEMPVSLASQSGSFCREFPLVQSTEHLACRYPLCPWEWRCGSCAIDATGHSLHNSRDYTSEPAQQPAKYTNRR